MTRHKCGHTPADKFNLTWDAEAIQGMLCPNCYFKPQNDEVAEKCKALGMPTLIGTDRQENWANHIRLRVASEIDTEIEASVSNFRVACRVARESVLQASHAGYWIALRNESGADFLPSWIGEWAEKDLTEEWPCIS